MKIKLSLLALSAMLAFSASAEPSKTPTTPKEKMGYAVGHEFASQFKREKMDVDTDMAIQGIRDAMADKSQLSPEELRLVLSGFQTEMRRQISTNRHFASLANRERNDKFFAENKTKDGVKELPNGVQYKIIKAANGPTPTDIDSVDVSYRGSLLNGTVFDKTEEGKTANLKVAGVIAGWRAVLNTMPLGSQWQVWIPANLAYGERGAGAKIGPNEPLVFDIELKNIVKGK